MRAALQRSAPVCVIGTGQKQMTTFPTGEQNAFLLRNIKKTKA